MLLVLPDDAPQMVIPRHLRAADWEYFITTVSGDEVIGGSRWIVDELINRDGYLIVPPASRRKDGAGVSGPRGESNPKS